MAEAAPKRCKVCGRAAAAADLSCDCGCLFLDDVLRLRPEQAESLLASNRAWLDHERVRGRRMLAQGIFFGIVPGLVTLSAALYGALLGLAVSGSIFAGFAAWGVKGARRLSQARRIAAASRIALPAARLHSPDRSPDR